MKVKEFLSMSLVAVAFVSLGSCSSDDKDEPDVPEQVFTDVLQKDKAAGSISQEEFEEKVMNRVWTFIYKSDADWGWLDVDGNTYDDSLFSPTGWNAHQAHYFDKEKYVDFLNMGPGFVNNNPYRRVNHPYRYDSSTGMVYVEGDEPRLLFYIESVDGDEMVIHESYTNWTARVNWNEPDEPAVYFKDPGEGGYNICARIVLRAVPEDKAQKYWWDKYKPEGEW